MVLHIPPAYFYAEEDALAELLLRYFSLNGKRKKELLDCAARLPTRG